MKLQAKHTNKALSCAFFSVALFFGALFCRLAFALFGAHLRSFARICVFLRPTVFRTTALGNCREFATKIGAPRNRPQIRAQQWITTIQRLRKARRRSLSTTKAQAHKDICRNQNSLFTFSLLISEDFWRFLDFPGDRGIFSTLVGGYLEIKHCDPWEKRGKPRNPDEFAKKMSTRSFLGANFLYIPTPTALKMPFYRGTKLSTSTIAALFSKIALTDQGIAMVDMLLLVSGLV